VCVCLLLWRRGLGADKRLLVRHNNRTRNSLSLLFSFLYSIGTLLIPLGGGGGWIDAQCNSLAAQHRSSLLLLMFLSSLLSFSSCSPASHPTLLSFFLSTLFSSSSSSFTFETMELCSAFVLLPKKKDFSCCCFFFDSKRRRKVSLLLLLLLLPLCVCLFTPRTRVMNGGELSDATIDHFFWHQATLLLLLLLPFPAPLINSF